MGPGNNFIRIPSETKELYLETMKELNDGGISYLAHGILISGVRTCFFSDSEWENKFLNDHLYENDPYTIESERSNSPYILWEDVEKSDAGLKIDILRKETCKIHSGITFSIHHQNYHEIIALGSGRKFLDVKSLAYNPNLKKALTDLLAPVRSAHIKYRLSEM